MTPGIVTIHRVRPGLVPYEEASPALTGDELLRVARFHFRKDALHWAACRASLRTILGEITDLPPIKVPLVLSEFGKPGLAHPFDAIHFNLSHCDDLAVVAIGVDGSVGIDLEKLDRAPSLLECEGTFCHPAEIDDLPAEIPRRAHQLLRIWTAKEAVLKALGTGLLHPPERIQVVFETPYARAFSDYPLPELDNLRIHELNLQEFAGYQGFVSAPDSVRSIQLSPESRIPEISKTQITAAASESVKSSELHEDFIF